MEVDAGRDVFSKLGIQNAAPMGNNIPWSPAGMEDMGAAASEDLPMAHITTPTLDS